MTDKPGDLLNDLREVMGAIDEYSQMLNAAKKQRAAIEAKLKDAAETLGVNAFKGDGISVSIREDFIASYDPERWSELVAWCGETGNTHIIQRRISTKPVTEMIDNGHALPAGVRLEPVTKLHVRRA